VKRPSPLETLKDLRQRVRESEQARLMARSQSEQRAELVERQARELLEKRSSFVEAVRQSEHQRLETQGITAAEGLRRLAWESAERRVRAQLASDLQHAAAQRRQAAREHEQSRRALERAHVELEVVEQKLEQRERQAREKAEQTQQEASDEASARRFSQRSGA
jgi:hypothetical protein